MWNIFLALCLFIRKKNPFKRVISCLICRTDWLDIGLQGIGVLTFFLKKTWLVKNKLQIHLFVKHSSQTANQFCKDIVLVKDSASVLIMIFCHFLQVCFETLEHHSLIWGKRFPYIPEFKLLYDWSQIKYGIYPCV